MTLDLIFWGLVFLFAFLGYLSGFLSQVMRLGVLISAYFLAGPVGKPFAPWLASGLGVAPMLGTVLGPAIAFLILYVVLSTIGWVVLRHIHKRAAENGKGKRTWDRATGAVLGGVKTFLMLFVLLNALVLLEKPLGPLVKRGGFDFKNSFMVSFARNHNLLAGIHLPVVGNVEAMGKLAHDPSFREKVAADPAVKKLLDHPKIKALLSDPRIVEASEANDVAGLLSNPKLNEAMEDPEIRKLLSDVDLSKL